MIFRGLLACLLLSGCPLSEVRVLPPNTAYSVSSNNIDGGTVEAGTLNRNQVELTEVNPPEKLTKFYQERINDPLHGGVVKFLVTECGTGIEYHRSFGDTIITRCGIKALDTIQKGKKSWKAPDSIAYVGGVYGDTRLSYDGMPNIEPGGKYIALLGRNPNAVGFGGGHRGVVNLTDNLRQELVSTNVKRRLAIIEAAAREGSR